MIQIPIQSLVLALSDIDPLRSDSPPILKMIVPLAVVIIVAGVLLAGLSIVRRKMRQDAAASAKDFSLGDLRTLHREGKLTDEEFERAKAKLVGNARSALIKETKPSLVEKPIGEELKDS